ncbi:MAG: hypothetical protein Q9191_001779 [Dirinaria sp. TL-2023a]
MWCFLGKCARRKSLKPDLFRKAVAKQSPTKQHSTGPTTPVSAHHCDAPSPLLQLNSKSQPELADEPTSPTRKEVEEDALKAEEGPSWEDVEIALGVAVSTDLANIGLAVQLEHQHVSAKAQVIEIVSSDTADGGLPTYEVATAQSRPDEPFETSQEPFIEDEEITICLPEEIRTPSPRFCKDSTPPSSKRVVSITTREITLPKYEQVDKPRVVQPASDHESVPTKNADYLSPTLSPERTSDAQGEGNVSINDPTILSSVQEAPVTPNTEGDTISQSDELSQNDKNHAIPDENGFNDLSHPVGDESAHPSVAVAYVNLSPQLEDSNFIPQQNEGDVSQGSTESAVDLSQPIDDAIASQAMPAKTTRSGARFSDDTNLLKDFLNRAQAKKLTKDLGMPENELSAMSPRRSPRKALAECTINSPSPRKMPDLAGRPGTPPGMQRLDAFTLDDADELSGEPMSCRRSTRIRLPAPPRLPPGAPSFIPVRRADRTEPVVLLQKSVAQDLAVQTRANTRRNKGQSKPPSVALQHLTAETVETICSHAQANEKAKSVGWDERLVYYYCRDSQDGPAPTPAPAPAPAPSSVVAEEGRDSEKRPKVRRLRGLGAANGTPAPKKIMANVSAPAGTPAPKRRGRPR